MKRHLAADGGIGTRSAGYRQVEWQARQSFAALAIAQGAHPLAIKERLGHSSITGLRTATGACFPRLEEAIGEGLDSVLRDSLAASVRPETASMVHLGSSAV